MVRAPLRGRRLLAVLAVAGLAAVLTTPAGAAPPPISGTHPWIVALCKFTDLSTEPSTYTPAYFGQMFAGTGYSGTLDFQHWWSQISYGNLSVAGTKVTTQWYSLGMTRYEWAGLNRFDKIRTCADAAAGDANIGNDYSKYYGVIAIFNDDSPARAASTTLSGAIGSGDTTITVASSAGFPAPPFAVVINDGSPNNGEEVHVTGVSGTTWTITRGYEGSTAVAHASGAAISLIDGGDLGDWGPGLVGVTINGKSYNLGMVVLPPETNLGSAQHETGHGFGYNHSRKLSTATSDYNDCFDIMSFDACGPTNDFQGDFGAAGVLNDPLPAAVGPGLDAINLDIQGWLPGGRTYAVNNSSCGQTTQDLAALNHPEATGDMEIRIPGAVTIPLPPPGGGTTSTDYYTLELRDKSFWDRGIAQNTVLVHLHGLNGYSYWVDQFGGSPVGHGGALYLGDEFVDTGNGVAVSVNRMDASAHTATVAVAQGGSGACKLNATLTYSGDTTGDYNDQVTLAGDLTVSGSSVPVPNAPVTFTLGSQSCPATTDTNGHASCALTVGQDPPGPGTVSGSYAGDSAYNAASGSASFTITKEESKLVYTGGTTAHYHDAFTASATLTDPVGGAPIAGKTVTFALNGVDTCSGTTDGSGNVSCSITPTEAAGAYTLTASFAGNTDYLSSGASAAFTVTKEETTTTYTGPTVILGGSGTATLTAQLQEDGANDSDADSASTGAPNPAGQTVKLSLGSQSCTGTVDTSGNVQCAISPVTVPLGPEPIKAEFLGDLYYQPSSDTSQTAVVFAFPSRGAFVLGDSAVAAAGPSTTLTWWSDSWSSLNGLTGGAAPASFKGFAGTVTTLPTTSPVTVCGTTFATRGGNSPAPPASVPSYMGVLVAGSVTQAGSTIDGTWGKIVVVETDPGYAPNPGHPGTGTIVATFCP